MNTKIKKLLSITAVASVVAISAAAYAFPAYYAEYIYYSDSSKTQGVGEKTITCMGTIVVTGQVTAYRSTLYKAPCGLQH